MTYFKKIKKTKNTNMNRKIKNKILAIFNINLEII